MGEICNADAYDCVIGASIREALQNTLHLIDPIGGDSVLHDNAAGTGLVTSIILDRQKAAGLPAPTIYATDNSEGMLKTYKERFADLTAAGAKIEASHMPGEKLTFPDATFTHSVTGFALPLFPDQLAGAREIYRTLRPGGVALMTGWSNLRHVDLMWKMQAAVRPDDPPFPFPAPMEWIAVEPHRKVMIDAGFDPVDVTVFEETVHWGAPGDVDAMAATLNLLLEPLVFGPVEGTDKAYTAEEKEKMKKVQREILLEETKPFTRADGTEWTTVELKAVIVVAKKK